MNPPGLSTAALDLGLTDRFQRLRAELGVEAFGLNLMHLAPGQRGRIHRHEHQEEVFIVLEGTLTIEIDGDEACTLERGGVARVAAPLRRRLINRGPGDARFLAIGGAGTHEGRDAVAWADWSEPESAARPPAEVPLPEDSEPG